MAAIAAKDLGGGDKWFSKEQFDCIYSGYACLILKLFKMFSFGKKNVNGEEICWEELNKLCSITSQPFN